MRKPHLLGAIAMTLTLALPAISQQTVPSAPVLDGTAPVGLENASGIGGGGVLVGIEPERGRADLPIIDPKDQSPAAGALRRLAAQDRAAGLAGVLYDNRDRGHSQIAPGRFPQLSRTQYTAELVANGADYGLAGPIVFSQPVIGNSSTAYKAGPLARSLPRRAMTNRQAARMAFRHYARNHIYVYPEHRDHDAETGDRYPANTAYQLISQGSSGSDQPFLDAIAMSLAAFSPQTRARLEELGLLAPTIQMVLRRGQSGVASDEDYLSGVAHPVVFNSSGLRPAALISLANAMTPEAIPPMVRLAVIEDFGGVPGRDYLAENLDETLFTTPSAVARIWRAYDHTRRITLSAHETDDPNGLPLTFHWVVLSGDAEKVRISHPDGDSTRANVDIDWHDTIQAFGPNGLPSARIEVGVFADNGTWLSAPAFFSVVLPQHQRRLYVDEGEGPRLQSLHYAPESDVYVDPVIWPVADWKDELSWRDGRLFQIERRFDDGTVKTIVPSMSAWAISETEESWHSAERDAAGVLRLRAN